MHLIGIGNITLGSNAIFDAFHPLFFFNFLFIYSSVRRQWPLWKSVRHYINKMSIPVFHCIRLIQMESECIRKKTIQFLILTCISFNVANDVTKSALAIHFILSGNDCKLWFTQCAFSNSISNGIHAFSKLQSEGSIERSQFIRFYQGYAGS